MVQPIANSSMPMTKDTEYLRSLRASVNGVAHTYPNSEQISPPVKKQKVRVVDPSTRTSVNLDVLKKYHQNLDALEYARVQNKIQQYNAEQRMISKNILEKHYMRKNIQKKLIAEQQILTYNRNRELTKTNPPEGKILDIEVK